ncbi:MAG: HugZ family protein [Nitrosospira sp.]
MSSARSSRQLLRAHRYGVLCTLSRKFSGYPFGSIATYLVDHDGSLLILISTLAEHTKNIKYDFRVSLITHDQNSLDIQSQGRVTMIGEAQPAMDKQQFSARYLRYFPEAQSYLALHDFSFYRIMPRTLRYIGGFGRIHWVAANSYLVPPYPLIGQEDNVIAHMNSDHRDTMRHYCQQYHQYEALDVEMLGIDCDGFDIRADNRNLRFDFGETVLDAQQARYALVEMAQRAG